jgi:PqqD family protein of HPr-rel-A system
MSTWQAVSSTEIDIRTWDGEHVIYHAASGNTHLLGAEAAEILLLLRQAPAEENAIAHHIAQRMQVDVDQDFLLQVRDMLSALQSITLVRPAA